MAQPSILQYNQHITCTQFSSVFTLIIQGQVCPEGDVNCRVRHSSTTNVVRLGSQSKELAKIVWVTRAGRAVYGAVYLHAGKTIKNIYLRNSSLGNRHMEDVQL